MLRKMCVLVALGSLLLSSGCCWRRCCCRPWLRRNCAVPAAPACGEPIGSCCHPGFMGPPPPATSAPPLAVAPR